ncbi:winged helix DNA-binding protein [Thiolinea disciformis]|uniref:winged helix DNA-binding protein n=1 Tax=Thiolinea disciformis TaxID=125614 RepID=UPI000377E662|nr:winged helix DNA-binding protein [Thiolinea disciformis]
MAKKTISHQAASLPQLPIVSSAHLAQEKCWQLSEMEYAMTMVYNAFSRWMVHCIASLGYKDFNPLDVLVLHNVNHRTREKRLADIVFTLNIDDNHTVNYSLKKLMKNELVESRKVGKEMFYQTTPKGQDVCEKYREVRNACLIDAAGATDQNFNEISHCALILRSLSGLYDQASRAASSL